MKGFYEIARLRRGWSLRLDDDRLSVDLDRVGAHDLIRDDRALSNARGKDACFWVSGGGSILINDRFLPVVQRSTASRVNPGRFSLFTGRADNAEERANPERLSRELFEELVLLSGSRPLMPHWEKQQDIINQAYTRLAAAGLVNRAGGVGPLPVTLIPLPVRDVVVKASGARSSHPLAWHMDEKGDINVIFLFSAHCNVENLRAIDGELSGNTRPMGGGRQIVLYDLKGGPPRVLSRGAGPEPLTIDPKDMTEILRHVLDLLAHLGLTRAA
jgi:hypothetical protein